MPLLSFRRPMPILFALSILAFVALLWATISIAGFVRRARRRRRTAAIQTSNLPDALDAASGASASLSPEPPPPRLRNFPTRLGKHPVNPLARDDARPEWNPFSKDIGDVSDPTPSRRYAPPRGRNKEDQ